MTHTVTSPDSPANQSVSVSPPKLDRVEIPNSELKKTTSPGFKLLETLKISYVREVWRSQPILIKASVSIFLLTLLSLGLIFLAGNRFNLNPRAVAVGVFFIASVAAYLTASFVNQSQDSVKNAAIAINRITDSYSDEILPDLLQVTQGEQTLHRELTSLSQHINQLQSQQLWNNRRRQFFSSITYRVRQSPNLETLYVTVVEGARELLDTDRVVVYRFNDDWSGTMVAESVLPMFPNVLNETIGDPCFLEKNAKQYQSGKIRAINDIFKEPGLTDCHVRMLDKYNVRANLVIPMRQGNQLVGLLIAHQCRGPRAWSKFDIDFMSSLSTEIEYSLDYIHFVKEQEATGQRAWFFGDIAFQARQSLALDSVFKTTVQGARKILKTDRVMIYRFNPDWSGTMIAESVGQGWTRVLDEKIDDPCFRGRYVDLYQNGRVRAIHNIRTEPGLTECHIRTLEKYDVKANLVAPLRKDGQLMGLLIAHHCHAPRQWSPSDIEFVSQLATQVEYAIDHLSFIEKIQANAGRARLFGDIAFRARQSLNQDDILKIVVQGARKALDTDRVLVYRFNPDWSGTMVAESVGQDWPKVLDEKIDDPCFKGRYVDLYMNGRVRAINDIYQEQGLTDCHIRTLEQYDVKANLVAPLRRNNELFGLLIAHHCAQPRAWQKDEIDFFSELATQTEYALDHVSFIDQLETARSSAETVSMEQRRQKEALQEQLEGLLQDMKGAFEGDLTVRATPQDGEIGLVGDFLNLTLENLQDIVIQVQSASTAVTETAQMNESNVQTLATEAKQQAESISLALQEIQDMTGSIQRVAMNTHQTQEMVREANQFLEEGDEAMNLTVDGIATIQETVEATAFKVKRLGEASQKISRVVNLIRDLANQTHVLALNASIEASGNNNEGKGFATVAEEVRSLAEQSTGATKEIEQIVEEIQSETNQVILAMEAGREQVITGTELVETTRNKLTSIAQVSAQIRSLVEEMTEASSAQAQTSSSVSSAMEAIEQIAQSNLEKSLAGAKSFNQLMGVAKALQERTAQFKVQQN